MSTPASGPASGGPADEAPRPARSRFLVLAALTLVGAVVALLVHPHGGRAALCWVGGVVLSAVALEVSIGNVRYIDRWMPKMTWLVAVFSYLMVVVLLGLVLAGSKPGVVVPGALAAGLVAGMLVEVGFVVVALWARSEHPQQPVTLHTNDDQPAKSSSAESADS